MIICRFFCFLLLLLVVLPAKTQSVRAYQKAGAKAIQAKDYYSAMEYYRIASERAPGNRALQYQYARAAQQCQAFDLAQKGYEKVLKSESAEEFPEARFYLAMVKKGRGQYTAAQKDFTEFIALHKAPEALKDQARVALEHCQWAMAQKENASDLKILQLKKSVNTPYSEFAPLLKGDTLYYSSLRYVNKEDVVQPPRKISKVLYSVRASRGRPLPRKFNEAERHTAHTTFSPNGNRMYFTICDYKEKQLDIDCQIYTREKGKRGRWGKAKALPESVNAPGFTNTQPNVAYDSLQASEVLYFVSNRPNGKGGLDIWYCTMKENGKPGEVKNLESINTTEDELSPYYYSPGATLFFSSNGYPGFGAYDIFQSTPDKDGNWTIAQNLGFPINSSYNDLYYSLNADSTIAHLASNREGALYLDRKLKSCCNDIYRIRLPQPIPEQAGPDSTSLVILPPLKDTLWAEEPPELPTAENSPPFEPTKLEDFLPLALYFDNDEPDRRTRRTTTRKTYGETFDRYYAQKSVYKEEYARGLSEERRWAAEDLIEDFFESEVARDHELLSRFSEILLMRLEGRENVEIFLKGFTSPRANSDYNLTLGQRRISSVRNHFYQYRNGIFLPYLNGGQLKITERSFGETSADQNVSADLDDRRSSIYSIGAARERRVEIMEIKTSFD